MIPEIGDKFIINWKGIKKIYPSVKQCEFPDKEFTILKFSKTMLSVYYLDNRTNKKCRCQNCSREVGECCIGVRDIIVTKKKLSVERDQKLKVILGANHHL